MDDVHITSNDTLNLENKLAYLQGVCSTLHVNNAGEKRVFSEIIQLLSEVVDSISTFEQRVRDVEEYVEDMDEDLANLEEAVFDGLSTDLDDYDVDTDASRLLTFADIECPECGVHFFVDQDFWTGRSTVDVTCPNCTESVTVEQTADASMH